MKTAAALLLLLAAAASATTAPTFVDFFTGIWDVEVYRAEQIAESLHYTLALRNGTTSIVEGSVINGDDERSLVQLEFKNDVSGEWKTAKQPETEDAEPEWTTLFEFAFQNYSNGFYLSQGKLGNGVYTLTVASPLHPAFVMTVASQKEGAIETSTWIARKFVEKQSAGFFQKYGMALMMGGFVLMQWMKRPQAPQQRRAAAAGEGNATEAAAAPAAAAAGESKKDD
eukprot:m51a1_g12296 hypothetical protein (227) ;mRNA; f:321763-323087